MLNKQGLRYQKQFKRQVLKRRKAALIKTDKKLLEELNFLGRKNRNRNVSGVVKGSVAETGHWRVLSLLLLFVISLMIAFYLTANLTPNKSTEIIHKYTTVEKQPIIKEVMKEVTIEKNPRYILDDILLNMTTEEICIGNNTERTCYRKRKKEF